MECACHTASVCILQPKSSIRCLSAYSPRRLRVSKLPLAGGRSVIYSRPCGTPLRTWTGSLRREGQQHITTRAVRPFVVATTETGEDVEEETMERMEKCIGSVKRNFGTIRTGRASPDMLDRIEVDYYGAATPLRQLAGVSVPESSMLVIQPYDKSAMQAIEKAIQTSDLGLTPNNDGKVIRLNIPQLTQERRKELAKQAAKMGEEGKVAIRNVRRDAMKLISQLKGDVGEDEQKALEDSVQEYTDDYVKQIDAIVKAKQDELSSV